MELKLTHVTKQYGTKTAVDHINMTLREGCLLYTSGAGDHPDQSDLLEKRAEQGRSEIDRG